MISFAKVTAEVYAGLTPVEDRVYYITDTGEMFLNGVKYGGGDQAQADWDQSDSSSPAYIQNKPVISDNADYLYIESVEPNITVQLDKIGTIASLPGVSLEYSLDKSTWNTYTWEEGTGYAITLESVGDRVWWRASSTNTGFGYDDNTYHKFSCSGLFNVGGCIMSLLDRNVQNTTTISSDYCFHSLFRQSRIAECGDIIPFNMTVKNTRNAFSNMFYGCSYLTKGPAVVLNDYNINNKTYGSSRLFLGFFNGCTSLIIAPRLHLKQLNIGQSSFGGYFNGCSLLQNIDNVILEETQYSLGKWAFQNMFQGCKSLVKAPAVPFRFLGEQCFSSMFSGCTSLEIGPDLKFSTYRYQCCVDMFNNCGRLKYLGVAFTSWDTTATANWISSASVGVLNCPSSLDTSTRDTSHIPAAWAAGNGLTYPSKVAATSSYNDLVDRPVIPDAQVQSDWDQSDSTAVDYIKDKPALAPVATLGTYNSLSGKPVIPNFTGDWFGIWHDMTDSAATTVTISVSGTNARANTFQYCTNISTNAWQDYVLGTTLTLTQYQYVLWRNKDAAKLLGNATGHYVFSITGGGVYLAGNLMTLKDKGGQYNNTASAYEFYQMFSGCTAIKDASMLSIPAAVISAQSCYGMFSGCTGMVRGPEVLPATVLGAQCYRFMFQDCTSLVKAPALPATSLESMCYHSMFKNCTALTEAPDLPAATVPSLAYNFMFHGCTALRHVRTAATALGTDNSQSWMTNVASSGVIECPSALDLSGRGADTAPAGWTVIRTDSPESVLPVASSTAATATVYAGSGDTLVLAPAADLTLDAGTVSSTSVGYAEVVIDLAVGATVTAGSNLTLVDTPEAGKRNVCVVRWSGGAAKLYVVLTEDLPA